MSQPGDDESQNLPDLPDLNVGSEGASVDDPKVVDGEDDDFSRPIVVDDSDEDSDPGFGSDPGLPNVTTDDGPEPTIAPPKQEDPNIGRRFGGFEITEKIGHGGMGTVYKGKQVSLDREVAIKILNTQLVNNVEFIRRFEREAKSIARIQHPNIVAVHDFGESDGLYYMVIEYVAGTNLSRMIAERLVLTPNEFLPILIQCLDGLEYVARTGTVHRDIKPDNILITEDGIAKIADFGLAKNTEASGDTDLTAHGSAMGTPAYMSPEQCMGRDLDFRSDIYAFGVTAYLALTGEKPFSGKSSFEIMTKHREYMPPPPAKLNPQLPQDVSDMVMRMLAKDPNERCRTVIEARELWAEIADRHGIMSSGRKSGEWPSPDLPGLAPELAPLPDGPSVGPSSSQAAAIPSPIEHHDLEPMMPELPDVPDQRGDSDHGFDHGDGGGSGDGLELHIPGGPMPKERPSSDSHQRSESGSEDEPGTGSQSRYRYESNRVESSSRRRPSSSMASQTCTACGMLNKATDISCQRCGNDLGDPSAITFEDRLARAEELMQRRRYKEAAQAFAKLADGTDDRRQRSVLRSREREARTRHDDEVFDTLSNRSEEALQRGDLATSIQVLERGLDDSSQSSELTARISKALTGLRSQRRKRWRKLSILVVIVGLLLALVMVWYFQHKIPGLHDLLPPALQRPAPTQAPSA